MLNKELIKNVEQWAEDKGILSKGTKAAQAAKVVEESYELFKWVHDGTNKDEIIDAIGDVAVTLIILNKMYGGVYEYPESFIAAPEDTYHLTASSILATSTTLYNQVKVGVYFEDSIEPLITAIFIKLHHVATTHGLIVNDCLDHAYGVISKRTGKMENGFFKKD